ncbi:MAG: hypothetical protein WCS95_10010 [Lentisphaeria bacterium]
MKTANLDDTSQVMSPQEKEILRIIIAESEPLPFETRSLTMACGPDALEYVIPDSAKGDLLKKLYPFFPVPDIDAMMFDLHEDRLFRVRDFKVIREDGRNYLVSPYYARSGGMVIDWLKEEDADSESVTPMLVLSKQ